MNIFVTGAAGFIGFSLCKKLLDYEDQIIAIDNLNPYYEVKLKEARIANLQEKVEISAAERLGYTQQYACSHCNL